MRFSHFFISRPIFAIVLSLFITIVGAVAYFALPVAQYPEVAPPTIQVTASYPGASAEVLSKTVATPLEQQLNGIENLLPQHRGIADAKPRPDRPAAPAGTGAAARPDGQEGRERLSDRSPSLLARWLARPALPVELRDAAHQGRDRTARRGRRRPDVRCTRLCHAHLARPGQGRCGRPHRRRRGCGIAGPERPGFGRRAGAAASRIIRCVPDQRRNPGPSDRSRAVRRHHRQVRRRRPGDPGPRHRPRRTGRARLQRQRLQGSCPVGADPDLPPARLERTDHRTRDSQDHGRVGQGFSARRRV